MTSGLRRILTRTATALAALTLTVGGVVALSASPAAADTVRYTMSCHDEWFGGTDYEHGATERFRASNSTCSYHYAWINVYYANSTGAHSTGKIHSPGQATVSSPVWYEVYRGGTYKSWHSGCSSSCHVEWTYA